MPVLETIPASEHWCRAVQFFLSEVLCPAYFVALHGWRRGVVVSGVRRMNAVNARRARLERGWVTVFGRVGLYHIGM